MPNKLIDIVGVSKSYGDNLVLDDPEPLYQRK